VGSARASFEAHAANLAADLAVTQEGISQERQRRVLVMISANAPLSVSYDYSEVTRSVLIAIAASYAALDLTGRVTAASGRDRLAWLGGGATAMGIGIWAMHFKGMLALRLPVSVEYHWPTVLTSLFVAVLASAVALYVASRQRMGPVEALTGGVIMSTGIAGMHYIGMAAMRLPAITRYSPLLVALSVFFAFIFSLVGLLLAFDLREETKWTVPRRLGSATVMGAAVSAMHYTGMAAASFMPASGPDLSHAVNISPIANSGIAIVTLIVIVAAITTSSVDRRTSAEVQRFTQELERRVIERTEQLNEAQANLARVSRGLAMGELVASIAHEVNQPLSGVVMNGNFVLRQLARKMPNLEEVQQAVTEVVEDANRVSTVISRVRSLLKKAPPDKVELDINEVVQEVSVLVRNETARNGVQVGLRLAAGLPRVQGDRVQLQQVLINLIMNAIDAMRTATDRARYLDIMSAKHADGVVVRVQDSGIGLDPDRLERIFEPFYTTKPQGIGIGLSISRSIIESHGGRLWTEPASYGAIFQFTLPNQ
jgi:NO-binding membrane sensor protein with MHYT domain